MSSAAQIAKLIDEFPSEAALEGEKLSLNKYKVSFQRTFRNIMILLVARISAPTSAISQ
jgi:hypothetical protein